jgi:hypothetical protein
MTRKVQGNWPGTAEIAFLRARLTARAAWAPSIHIVRPGRGGTCRTIAAGQSCNCGTPRRLLAAIAAEREMLRELEDMLGGDPFQEGMHALTILTGLVTAYPEWPGAGGGR